MDITYTGNSAYDKLILILFLIYTLCLVRVFHLGICKIICILVYKRSVAFSPFATKTFINV